MNKSIEELLKEWRTANTEILPVAVEFYYRLRKLDKFLKRGEVANEIYRQHGEPPATHFEFAQQVRNIIEGKE